MAYGEAGAVGRELAAMPLQQLAQLLGSGAPEQPKQPGQPEQADELADASERHRAPWSHSARIESGAAASLPLAHYKSFGHGGVVAVGPGAGHLFTALEKLGKCSLHVAVCSGSSSSGSSGSSGSSSSGSSSGAGGLRVAAAAAVRLGTQPGGWMTFSQPKKLASDLAVAAAAGACDELLLLLCQQGGEPCPTLFQFPIAAGTATATLPHIVPRLARLAAEAAAAAAPVAASLVHAWPGLSLNGFTKKLQLSGELMGFPAVRLRCIGRAHQQAEQLCTQLPCTSSGHAAQRGTAMLPQLQCSSAATAGTAFRFLAATHVVCSLAFCSPRCSSDRGD